MKTNRIGYCQCARCDHAAKARGSRIKAEHRVRRLINTACAARAGSAQMTSNDWQEVELELNEWIENEYARWSFGTACSPEVAAAGKRQVTQRLARGATL